MRMWTTKAVSLCSSTPSNFGFSPGATFLLKTVSADTCVTDRTKRTKAIKFVKSRSTNNKDENIPFVLARNYCSVQKWTFATAWITEKNLFFHHPSTIKSTCCGAQHGKAESSTHYGKQPNQKHVQMVASTLLQLPLRLVHDHAAKWETTGLSLLFVL